MTKMVEKIAVISTVYNFVAIWKKWWVYKKLGAISKILGAIRKKFGAIPKRLGAIYKRLGAIHK